MGSLVLLKKFTIFLLISLSLFTATFAGRRTKFVSKLPADVDVQEEEVGKEEESVMHERLLRANTRDYGRYDPSPTLSKPPSKLIPNSN
ncbi:protein CASPARIAN STRIP INTEGRITY FACTOR 1-like [Neltuma alba]|uniref:protein CASPARIAN STRIP INTEGRITY FACTOR 1-like n=1 Tax=Neltuma alba TaxID=207710 RepID=UPI0010A578D5|nr:protein CASPARIAN STRIP INTEGRITY FACTOR 1-like [Prosopis alba]XP_028787494.1 protein CASPARIAN STRIP INTEGRITY FACTOR 1-like [Prosopis alba]